MVDQVVALIRSKFTGQNSIVAQKTICISQLPLIIYVENVPKRDTARDTEGSNLGDGVGLKYCKNSLLKIALWKIAICNDCILAVYSVDTQSTV